ncbi:hypothetical protein AT251_18420 [Enterovibrio nigricans]|uniref:Uncharacterized protein n=1 Tax=Enterovibrio nigricans DSM 22720 TaxID=1121868 RepID=A0A1T4UM80_9GAMM|nr:hypothetical protein AT251_18420 [Enterovibrio nigricans]SKA53785.1 hypothetical protein SAMN02745132_02026 [Enterovibrio nigricans DSM 22720]
MLCVKGEDCFVFKRATLQLDYVRVQSTDSVAKQYKKSVSVILLHRTFMLISSLSQKRKTTGVVGIPSSC